MKKVAIIMGSDSDLPVVSKAADTLKQFGVPFELHIFPFGGHGLSTCDSQTIDDMCPTFEYNSAWLVELKKWLKVIFK